MPDIIQKFWQISNPNPQKQKEFSDALGVHPIVAQLLLNRGVTASAAAKEFLSGDVSGLHDPFLMQDMDRAVERIRAAAAAGEKVLIYGDYDVDGVTSLTILHYLLGRIGISPETFIPHRMTDGYGLTDGVVELARDKQITLVIAVDCGITAVGPVKALNEAGVDTIIFDHHEPGEEGLPPACAVVDPKRADCRYPFKSLASAGLMAKLCQALEGEVAKDILDLVALGTIADVVPLVGENRILVRAGLPCIESTRNKGLSALMDVAKIKGKPVKPYYVGFILGPRINATGRMDTAQTSLDLFLAKTDGEARILAEQLEQHNLDRQRMQREVVDEALAQIEAEGHADDGKVIVLSKEGWHKGVLGIVASRVAETYYRPAIVISLEEGVGTASARSVGNFHLHEALTHCSQVLENFGGHKLAAGLTIRAENIDRFRELINSFAGDLLEVRDLIPTLRIDTEVPVSCLNLDLAKQLDLLEPYGEGNPGPVFCSRQLLVKSAPRVMGRETIKFWVTDGQTTISAVGFGMAKYRHLVVPGRYVDLAYQVGIDDWKKAPVVQLNLKDIRESGTAG